MKRSMRMKRLESLFVLIIVLAVAGGLGYLFQPNFAPIMYIIFAVAILVLSEVFCQIDKRISEVKT